jgi:large subunit ribosomal protein L21
MASTNASYVSSGKGRVCARERERRTIQNMFAVIKSGGRQYKVSVGERLEVNRLPVEPGTQVAFDEVLLISDANGTMVGNPLVENALVLATADEQGRGKKVIVFKYKSKKRYRHRRGHRQELTFLTIDDIVANGKSLVTGEAPKAKESPAAEEELPELETAPEAETEEETGASEEPETETTEPETGPGTEPRIRRRRTRNEEEA